MQYFQNMLYSTPKGADMHIKQLKRVSDLLSDFVECFAPDLGRSERRHWCKMYLSGLLLDGERKSIEPMSERLQGGNEQALQQFVNQSPWDHKAVGRRMRRLVLSRLGIVNPILDLDDTALPKKGNHSVGVASQYCGALGKLANCQSIVTWQAIGKTSHIPLSARLYLPESWTDNKQRMARSGVPEAEQRFREKWKIALELLDEMIAEGIKPRALLFDAGYGSNRSFLKEIDRREIPFVTQVRNIETFWDGDIATDRAKRRKGNGGRPQKFVRPEDRRLRPKSADEWAFELFEKDSNVRHAILPLRQRRKIPFVAKRVYEAVARPFHRVGPIRWLLIERLPDNSYKYYVSSFGANVSPSRIIRMAHERWKVEQGYQQLKEELGLDHFEGRSWTGLHHHIILCFMAYAFLQILGRRQSKKKDDRLFPRFEDG
jgi:SRSO17 transposase